MNPTFDAVELDRAQLFAAFERLFRNSKWPANRPRDGRRPSFGLSAIIFVVHMLGTAALYTIIFTVAWTIGIVRMWLNSIHPFADDVSELASRVELALVYIDTALCACFSFGATWRFLKEIIQ
jgi:hypothetical protein